MKLKILLIAVIIIIILFVYVYEPFPQSDNTDTYTFIHPTKTGGTTFENYIEKHYNTYIKGRGHKKKCADVDNPIIILRNPYDRFISSYKYWKNGSPSYERPIEWKKYNNHVTIDDYIEMVKNKDKRLIFKATRETHYAPQTYWIKPEDYKKTIVITYSKDGMEKKVFDLLKKLYIKNKYIPYEKINVSYGEDISLTPQKMKKIYKLYEDDFILWDKVHNNKSLFKLVI
jgi:hypothetical protein